jgi:hypothetical protein
MRGRILSLCAKLPSDLVHTSFEDYPNNSGDVRQILQPRDAVPISSHQEWKIYDYYLIIRCNNADHGQPLDTSLLQTRAPLGAIFEIGPILVPEVEDFSLGSSSVPP